MAGTLHIGEMVVTEQVLQQQHAGQTEVLVAPRAVVTPSGWDYLRDHRLRLRRGEVQVARPHPQAPPSPTHAAARPAVSSGTAAPAAIAEVLPPGSDSGVLSRGRYEHPDRAFGCRTEEFGSGFVEPSSCDECAVRRAAARTDGGCGCGGCNKASGGGDDLEILVQRLTDEIMARLGGG